MLGLSALFSAETACCCDIKIHSCSQIQRYYPIILMRTTPWSQSNLDQTLHYANKSLIIGFFLVLAKLRHQWCQSLASSVLSKDRTHGLLLALLMIAEKGSQSGSYSAIKCVTYLLLDGKNENIDAFNSRVTDRTRDRLAKWLRHHRIEKNADGGTQLEPGLSLYNCPIRTATNESNHVAGAGC